MRCTANFTGTLAPIIEWRRLNEDKAATDADQRELTGWAKDVVDPNVKISS